MIACESLNKKTQKLFRSSAFYFVEFFSSSRFFDGAFLVKMWRKKNVFTRWEPTIVRVCVSCLWMEKFTKSSHIYIVEPVVPPLVWRRGIYTLTNGQYLLNSPVCGGRPWNDTYPGRTRMGSQEKHTSFTWLFYLIVPFDIVCNKHEEKKRSFCWNNPIMPINMFIFLLTWNSSHHHRNNLTVVTLRRWRKTWISSFRFALWR